MEVRFKMKCADVANVETIAGPVSGRPNPSRNYWLICSDEVLEAMALASRTLYEVLGLGRQVLNGLGLGLQVLDNWLPHKNFTFCNYSMK